MQALIPIAGLGVVTVAVIWLLIIAPNRKKRAAWHADVLRVAQAKGAVRGPEKYGFESFRVDTPWGPLAGFVSAGLVIEASLINRRAYRSNGSAFYANFIFDFPKGDGPVFEVCSWGYPDQTLSAQEIGDSAFAGAFRVAARSGEEFRARWTDQARALMMRSGGEWLVAGGGRQIQAVRYGAPTSTQEAEDMLDLVRLLATGQTS